MIEIFRGEVYWDKEDCCYYCGEIANTVDHVVPRSLLRHLDDMDDEEARKQILGLRKLTVPACKECNTLLGNSFQRSLTERKQELKKKLKKKYQKFINMPSWEDSELKELKPRMQQFVLDGLAIQERVKARLSW